MTILSFSKNRAVLLGVAYHKSTSYDVLKKLSVSPYEEVREGIAYNPSATIDLLLHISFAYELHMVDISRFFQDGKNELYWTA